MRILLQTKDPLIERSYLNAAEFMNRHRLCILRSEAQVLERLFRDPFDTLIIDDASLQANLLPLYRRNFDGNLVLLMRDSNPELLFQNVVIYAFARTYEPAYVLQRVASFPRNNNVTERREVQTSAYLQRIGVPVHLKGFSLLKTAIRFLLTIDRPTEIHMIEDVYAVLAKSDRCSVSLIEHAMRHAIEAAWLRADVSDLEEMFGYTVSPDRAALSNAGFLLAAADRIQMINRRGIS